MSFSKWIELDFRYIREQNVLTDIRILLLTIPAVLGCKLDPDNDLKTTKK